MSAAISPLAPKSYPALPVIDGVRFATASAGIKYKGRTDVLLMLTDEGTQVAGVFTKSKCPSAPVDWCRANLSGGSMRALLINSGNANAFTGKKGKAAVELTAKIVSEATGVAQSEIYLASTGVIGEPLPAERFEGVMAELIEKADGDAWQEAAKAIMTTDTYPKVATRTVEIDGQKVVLNGIAKGAGMIAPDMATMLGFLFTDANISAPALQALLSDCVGGSFNAITVDSDTSTSDSVLLAATCKAGHLRVEDAHDERLADFRAALADMMQDLAHQIVKDGEGATKFVEVRVEGAADDASAKRIGLAIANSPLVKTAIAGEDANWGRVVMAVGKAGEPADRDRLAIWFGDIRVAVEGERDADYSEEAASAVMREEEILLKVDIGLGSGSASVWTCDLTKEYVAINGDYRS
ncbi:bifunctional glutamate N-acetyltransferase/amino-acid acetyltransferase ArgJ [Rhodobacteraceae bacterium RKSG542]|uniref:bifunctional glutamate N-acetyltransferase/amino-acid acetyltransferase ArgJ n=1 Tax=Pseudovibrio flavus TaxID=2529854 RepID=UPI0012BD6CE2|nr:bifunctional glutamate N-acetyltransferase/amino-acid acetyltransferase ArgJ [Pseudovibrio flavus]MTI18267.1 bifunctional glutamate N-acetyltransferase/amino-acid acetyltransferase ArgJ [Pseudovibrio flavus]